MRRMVIYFVVSLLFLIAFQVNSEELTAEEAIAKSWKLYRQAKTEKEFTKIIVEYKDGRKVEKELTRYIKFDTSGQDKVMIKFSKPPLDEGLGLLIWRYSDKSDDIWIKFPSFTQERRISINDQAKYFAETDFTYEDSRQLIGERTKDFSYRLLENKGGLKIIEAIPKTGVETGYGKRIIQMGSEWAIVRVEYYGKNGKLLKIQTNKEIKVEGNGRWRTNYVEIENLLLQRKTVMKVVERRIDIDVPAEVFSRKFLTSNR